MKAAVIVFPGSNCDRDLFVAIKKANNGKEPLMIWHQETKLPDLDLIAIPGGFSYGDYLRSGAIAARSPIMQEIIKKAKDGVKVIGICNGFQVLTESGLLPGILMRNKKLKFICKKVNLKVTNNKTAFTSNYKNDQVINLPIAHQEGNYFTSSDELKFLQDNEMIAFQYCDKEGNLTEEACFNGALHNIAGIFNKGKNVLGMMPHPERHSDVLTGGVDGLDIFKSLIK